MTRGALHNQATMGDLTGHHGGSNCLAGSSADVYK